MKLTLDCIHQTHAHFHLASQAVGALMNARISLLELCHDSNIVIQDYAIDLVKELFSITDLDQVHELQESAREYGALLFALTTALGRSVRRARIPMLLLSSILKIGTCTIKINCSKRVAKATLRQLTQLGHFRKNASIWSKYFVLGIRVQRRPSTESFQWNCLFLPRVAQI